MTDSAVNTKAAMAAKALGDAFFHGFDRWTETIDGRTLALSKPAMQPTLPEIAS